MFRSLFGLAAKLQFSSESGEDLLGSAVAHFDNF
jgi:hypothetical protein